MIWKVSVPCEATQVITVEANSAHEAKLNAAEKVQHMQPYVPDPDLTVEFDENCGIHSWEAEET